MESASTTTRAQVIAIKYNNTISKLTPLLDDKTNSILPSLADISLADIIFYFGLTFTDGTDEYQQNLRDIMKCQGISVTDETFKKIHAIVLPFIQFLKTFAG